MRANWRPSLEQFLSALEQVIGSTPNNFFSLRTTYSRLDKLSPDDATLPPVSW